VLEYNAIMQYSLIGCFKALYDIAVFQQL